MCSGCVVATREVRTPSGNDDASVLASGALSEPISEVARHAWFAVRDRGDPSWERWEIWGYQGERNGYVRRKRGDPLADVGGGRVRVHAVLRGTEAAEFNRCLRTETRRYEHKNDYLVLPGPNSNTYVDIMLRRCGFHATLPATALGKDHRGWVGASLSSGGTGVQLETALIGLKLGLTEGVELHLFGLSWGVDLWPPALVVPLYEGRIGFDDW